MYVNQSINLLALFPYLSFGLAPSDRPFAFLFNRQRHNYLESQCRRQTRPLTLSNKRTQSQLRRCMEPSWRQILCRFIFRPRVHRHVWLNFELLDCCGSRWRKTSSWCICCMCQIWSTFQSCCCFVWHGWNCAYFDKLCTCFRQKWQ